MKMRVVTSIAVISALYAGSAFADVTRNSASSDAAAAAIAAATSFSNAAIMVNTSTPWYGTKPGPGNTVRAYTDQSGGVYLNTAVEIVSIDINRIVDSFNDASGIAHAGQNAGANSLIQANSTIAAILGCNCDDKKINDASTKTYQWGGVTENVSVSLVSDSVNSMNDSFEGFSGLAQVQQNTGNNSLMQSNATISAIIK